MDSSQFEHINEMVENHETILNNLRVFGIVLFVVFLLVLVGFLCYEVGAYYGKKQ